jgi:hypothetical protein
VVNNLSGGEATDGVWQYTINSVTGVLTQNKISTLGSRATDYLQRRPGQALRGNQNGLAAQTVVATKPLNDLANDA